MYVVYRFPGAAFSNGCFYCPYTNEKQMRKKMKEGWG